MKMLDKLNMIVGGEINNIALECPEFVLNPLDSVEEAISPIVSIISIPIGLTNSMGMEDDSFSNILSLS